MKANAWETHDWFDRPLEIDSGQKLTQFVCRKCGRGFVGDSTGKRYAIHASTFEVKRLADQVTDRWLAEPCPEQIQMTDRNDGKTRFQVDLPTGDIQQARRARIPSEA